MNKNVEPNVLINISSLDVGNKKMLVKLQEYLRTIEGDNTIGFHIIESSKVIRLNLKVDKDRISKRKIQDIIKSIEVEIAQEVKNAVFNRKAQDDANAAAQAAYEAEQARIAEEERQAEKARKEEEARKAEEARIAQEKAEEEALIEE